MLLQYRNPAKRYGATTLRSLDGLMKKKYVGRGSHLGCYALATTALADESISTLMNPRLSTPEIQ